MADRSDEAWHRAEYNFKKKERQTEEGERRGRSTSAALPSAPQVRLSGSGLLMSTRRAARVAGQLQAYLNLLQRLYCRLSQPLDL